MDRTTETRPTAKEVFRANCLKQTDGFVTGMPVDVDEMLDHLLALGHCHVMVDPFMEYGDKKLHARTTMHADNDHFITAVKGRIDQGQQVFLFSYHHQSNNGPNLPEPLIFWRWCSTPKIG